METINPQESLSLPFASHPTPNIHKVYPYRFLITTFYAIIAVSNAIMSSCLSSIVTNLADMYQIKISTATFAASLIWFITYPFVSILANYFTDQKGLKCSVVLGAIFTLIGLWTRVLCEQGFIYIILGQFLGAFGQPFLLNVPQKLSVNWYSPKERPIATAVASLVYPTGAGLGLLVAHIFVNDNDKGHTAILEVKSLFMFFAILGSVLILPCAFFFRDSPPTPPSKAADIVKYSYRESLQQLFKNKNYLLLIISTGLVWGGMNTLAALIQPIFKPFGFSGGEAGIIGALTLLCGLIGSAVMSLYVSKSKKYKKIFIISSLISVLSIGLDIFAALSGKLVYPILISGIYGFFTTPLLPLSFELCSEISFPVAEGASGGFLMFMIEIFSVTGTLGVGLLVNNDTKKNALLSVSALGIMTILGSLGYTLVKEDLKRHKFESQDQDQD